jgi:hypothetical protein
MSESLNAGHVMYVYRISPQVGTGSETQQNGSEPCKT